MLIGYARTSTIDQAAGLEAQRRDLEAAGCEKILAEHSSSVGDRLELKKALDYLRTRDTLVVTKIDRLARSTLHLWEIVKGLEARGAGLRVLSLGGEMIDTRSATGRLILTLMSGIAGFERDVMLERQREGIARAKAAGKYRGRKPTARSKAIEVDRLRAAGKTPTQIARELCIGRGSVYRILGLVPIATIAAGAPPLNILRSNI
jgi:DNA invertase Pin-like site-specific DNA recombinase